MKNIFQTLSLAINYNEAKKKIKRAKFDEVPEYYIQGIYTCKVLRVYDGDTIWVCIYRKGKSFRLNCRILGIDTPEMPRAHKDAMEDYYKTAFAARDRVVQLVTNCVLPKNKNQFTDESGTQLPSLSDKNLQELVDKNTKVLKNGIELLNGTDKYGRYLARIKLENGKDLSQILLDEKLAKPY